MKSPAIKLAVVLLVISTALITYRIVWLEYPLFPTAPGQTWRVSFEAGLKPGADGIQVEVGLPQDDAARRILSEETVSGLLDLDIVRNDPNRFAVWSGLVKDEIFAAYRASILVQPTVPRPNKPPQLPDYSVMTRKAEQDLAGRLVRKWLDLPLPKRLEPVTEAAYGNWEKTNPSQPDLDAWLTTEERHDQITTTLLLLTAARIPARSAHGLRLTRSAVQEEPLTWIQAWTGSRWVDIELATGVRYEHPASLLPLAIGRPAVVLASGEVVRTRWDIRREVTSTWLLHYARITKATDWLNQLSLFNLPPEFQETFRVLLLVPLSALLVCVFRNIVGLPTFGIFMPVLMALAFRATGLAYGLGIFAFVIFIGYGFRRGVNNLRLLLVPRLAVLLSMVIFFIVIFAIIGNMYGVREFMAVGLLPIVILTMTIERFFILVEESGVREALKTAAGTAVVSTLTYGIILWEPLQLTFFVYPELIFAVTGLQVLVGRYTGFRLSEFGRFKALRGT